MNSSSCPVVFVGEAVTPDHSSSSSPPDFAVMLHGGAGVIGGASSLADKDLTAALLLRKQTLKNIYTKAHLEAAEAARKLKTRFDASCSGSCALGCETSTYALAIARRVCLEFENSGLFNAGRGSCLTAPDGGGEGRQEPEASVMCGSRLQAGAAVLLRNTRNPVELATAVMNHTRHVMIGGKGAEDFGRLNGVEMMSDEEVMKWETQAREKQKEQEKKGSQQTGPPPPKSPLP
eukprot:GHVS01084355.1.p1 GENE.GHVS01084355.1~~GHVS01084355.1.p1  ORF type:complete len:234 (-),score=62.24 GHVS01084355.1:753-1454(-)